MSTAGAHAAAAGGEGAPVRERYLIRTFGCQMNEHDSERLAGLLEAEGLEPAAGLDDADLVVLNTCAVRENADNKLYGTLGHLATTKASRGLTIAVGGCLAQKDQHRVLERAPWVDVVFGTHNLHSLPVLLRRARDQGTAQAEFFAEMQRFPSALPARRASDWSAWVAISVGCNNTCTFCIVPSLRGKERSRRVGDVVAEVQALADAGVLEISLLGQNVNSYGTDLPGHRQLFGDLLRALDGVEGLERLRFTSPNPKDFRDDVVEAMATCRPLCEHVHFPLQSGSDRVLRLMRRGYRRRRYLEILANLRAAIPGVAFSTDIIVGFPGETEADFADTLDLVEQARFDSAFTFQYSPRPGTEAATMPDQVPPDAVKDRFQRLLKLQERISLEANRALVGTEVELLVEQSTSKTNPTRMSGRTRTNKLCHFPAATVGGPGGFGEPGASGLLRDPAAGRHVAGPAADATEVAPGDLVTVRVEQAAPHHLVGGPLLHHHPRRPASGSCGDAPTPRPLPAGAVPLPLVG
jgi:tRNA-2-methylthio-N6-dimethylallyladenosine synthase